MLDENDLLEVDPAWFLTEEDIVLSPDDKEGHAYTCIGYPNSKNKHRPTNESRIIPVRGNYTSTARPSSVFPKNATDEDHLLIDFHPKLARDENGNKVNAVAFRGFSGGAIIDVERLSLQNMAAETQPKLAALFIEAYADEKVILGVRLSTILNALKVLFSEYQSHAGQVLSADVP